MITLTPRAQQRLVVFTALDRGELLMAEAAELLGLSSRQVRHLCRAVRRHGPKALVHGNCGRHSPRRVPDATRTRIVQRPDDLRRGQPQAPERALGRAARPHPVSSHDPPHSSRGRAA